jgi:hypothetical protein
MQPDPIFIDGRREEWEGWSKDVQRRLDNLMSILKKERFPDAVDLFQSLEESLEPKKRKELIADYQKMQAEDLKRKSQG